MTQILEIICINKKDYIITGQKTVTHHNYTPNFIMQFEQDNS